MYYYLNGELAHREAALAVIDCGGVGYQLTVSAITSEALAGKLGQKVKLYTFLAVREDGMELFGFGSTEERRCFLLLTSVSGIGPRAAMSILSTMDPNAFSVAVSTENILAISKAPGIGKKTAARVILELRDKIAKERPETDAAPAPGGESLPTGGHLNEAAEALMVLGYDKNTAIRALGGEDPSTDVSELIRHALKKMSL